MSSTLGMLYASQAALRRFCSAAVIASPFLLGGAYMIGAGLGWIPVRLHVPGWVVAVLGLPFLGTGLYILGIISQMRDVMALMLIAFLLFFNWAAFSDDPLCYSRRADHVRPQPRHVVCEEDTGAKRLPLIVACVIADIVVVALVARRVRRYFVHDRGVDLEEE